MSKKVLMVLGICFLFCWLASAPVKADDLDRIFFVATGADADIPLAHTLIVGKIEVDSGMETLGRLEFVTEIYNESGAEVYSMHGKLKDPAPVAYFPFYFCTVRQVYWTNLRFVMASGEIKTTGTLSEIEYRDKGVIPLPNTEGEYVPALIFMMLSPNGEYVGGVWPEGGWAVAGIVIDPAILLTFGGITYLKNYKEK